MPVFEVYPPALLLATEISNDVCLISFHAQGTWRRESRWLWGLCHTRSEDTKTACQYGPLVPVSTAAHAHIVILTIHLASKAGHALHGNTAVDLPLVVSSRPNHLSSRIAWTWASPTRTARYRLGYVTVNLTAVVVISNIPGTFLWDLEAGETAEGEAFAVFLTTIAISGFAFLLLQVYLFFLQVCMYRYARCCRGCIEEKRVWFGAMSPGV